jgi:hypothetical protein
MSILGDLADFFPDTISGQPGSQNAYGDFVASGSATSVNCYISQKARTLVDRTSGREVVSTVKVTIDGVPGFNTRDYRYTLPARYAPGTDLEAMAWKSVSDEDGPHHEVLFFP